MPPFPFSFLRCSRQRGMRKAEKWHLGYVSRLMEISCYIFVWIGGVWVSGWCVMIAGSVRRVGGL